MRGNDQSMIINDDNDNVEQPDVTSIATQRPVALAPPSWPRLSSAVGLVVFVASQNVAVVL